VLVAAPIEEETLAPDEPPTPAWMPVLGAALLLLALTWFVAY